MVNRALNSEGCVMQEHANDGPVIALVLGSGWKLGVSFHAGVLLALRDVWGVDARFVDSVTGTSTGALTAGFVGAGLGPDDMLVRCHRQRTDVRRSAAVPSRSNGDRQKFGAGPDRPGVPAACGDLSGDLDRAEQE